MKQEPKQSGACARSLLRLVMALALCGTLAGCDDTKNKTVIAGSESATIGAFGALRTVKHDGHLWVVRDSYGSPVHHPGCKCHNDIAQRTAGQKGEE